MRAARKVYGSRNFGITGHGSRSSNRRSARRALTLSLLLTLVASVALVYVMCPDPVWLGGIHDAADDDHLVSLLSETAIAFADGRPQQVPPLVAPGTPSSQPTSPSGTLLSGSLRPRSPPLL